MIERYSRKELRNIWDEKNKYTIWLIDENGKIGSKKKGVIKANSQLDLDFSSLPGCPKKGWFLVSCMPLEPSYYGTLRPQGLLIGDNWSSAVHLQPHMFVSNVYRRMSIVIKAVNGYTRNRLFVFNGLRKNGSLNIELKSRNRDFVVNYETEINGNGLCDINIDKIFPAMLKDDIYLLTVNSSTFTKKYLASVSPRGEWSADHFPTLP